MCRDGGICKNSMRASFLGEHIYFAFCVLLILRLGVGVYQPECRAESMPVSKLLEQVDIAESTGEWQQIIAHLEIAISEYETRLIKAIPEQEYRKAEAYYSKAKNLDDLEIAYAAYKLAANNMPGSIYRRYALFRLGDIQRRRVEIDTQNQSVYLQRTVEHYLQALEQCPSPYPDYPLTAGNVPEYPEMARAEFAAYWIGDYYYERGQIDRAEAAFRVLTEMFPQGYLKLADNAQYRLALCLMDQGKWDQVPDVYASFQNQYADSQIAGTALLKWADSYFYAEGTNVERAEQLYAEVVRLKKIDKATRIAAAEKLLRLYTNLHLSERVEHLKQKVDTFISQVSPDKQLAFRIAYGEYLAERADYAQVCNQLRMLQSADLHDTLRTMSPLLQKMYWSLLAQASYETGDYATAVECYENLRMFHELPPADFAKLNRAYLHEEQEDKAIILSKNWLAARSGIAPVLPATVSEIQLVLAEAYRQRKDYRSAIEHFGKVLEIRGDVSHEAEALRSMGDIYFEQKDYAQVLQVYRRLYTDYQSVVDADLLESMQQLIQLIPEGDK